MKALLFIVLFFVGCATAPKQLSDLRMDTVYPLAGAPGQTKDQCTIKTETVITRVPGSDGMVVLPSEYAIVCGELLCGAPNMEEKIMLFQCIPAVLLYSK
jgi:hypothetical protein